MKPRFPPLVWPLAVLVASGCSTLPPTSTVPPPSIPAVTSIAPAFTQWAAIADGIERREVPLSVPKAGVDERLILFRIDSARLNIRVHYSPGTPLPMSGWAAQLPGAALIFNGGFFDEANRATGLVVSDGVPFGSSYLGFGGMFGVQAGMPFVRPLDAAPTGGPAPLDQAVQGSPMLLVPGGGRYFAAEDEHRSRRTAIGQTADGRLMLIVAPRFVLTLSELSAFLSESDLGLQSALNLDGGSSTGYWAGGDDWLESITPIPAVVAAYSAP